jgi:predicted NUDIX family NTP pyrophosphohydrolase
MAKRSAGILLYRRSSGGIEVLLVHPGGPFWAKKDEGAWSIPKGLYEAGEDALAAAKREFEEETGFRPEGDFTAVGAFRQSSGKVIEVWAVEGDFDPNQLKSNMFAMEWPPRSGRVQHFPEADRAGWFPPDVAERKLLKGQRQMLSEFLKLLAAGALPRERHGPGPSAAERGPRGLAGAYNRLTRRRGKASS